MIQHKNGSFSDILDYNGAIQKFEEALLNDDARALYIGTKTELQEIKAERDIQSQLDEMKRRIESLEKPKSSLIHLPTQQEIMDLKL